MGKRKGRNVHRGFEEVGTVEAGEMGWKVEMLSILLLGKSNGQDSVGHFMGKGTENSLSGHQYPSNLTTG